MINKKLLAQVFNDEFELKNKTYKIDFSNFHPRIIVDDPQKVPNTLYKYVDVNGKHSISNLINYNLYCSEPDSFNDVFDTLYALIHPDAYSIELKGFERLLRIIFNDKSTLINEEKYKHKEKFAERCRDTIFNWWVSFNGIVCLTDSPESDLMWAHYTNNEGFALEFITENLPPSFSNPIPIYYENLDKILRLDKKNVLLEIYVRSLCKKTIWEYENEYRCFNYPNNQDYLNNYGLFTNQKYPGYKQERITKYAKKSLKSITLGFSFFKNLIHENFSDGYTIIYNEKSNKNIVQVTEFIIEEKLPCYLIFINPKKTILERRLIKIEKIDVNMLRIFTSEQLKKPH
ncbi:MAG: DUF2971 domain-containing protein [Chitinophagales bacterium]